MIDFRYHLVSIVAIFLALAIGIVLGTTVLNGPVSDALVKSNDQLKNDANNLRAENAQAAHQLSVAESFAQATSPRLLGHLLDGQRVVVVAAPGAPGEVQNGITTMLQQAGATVTGQVQLQDKFFDTSATTLSYMDQLSQGLRPAGLALTDGTPQERAAQVLASAIVAKSSALADSATSQAIISGFAGGGFVTVSGQPPAGATLAVVVTPADPLTGPDAAAANAALTAVAAAVNSAGLAAVMAGPASSTQPGGAIAALRGSAAAAQVSSVDDADTSFGQVVVVQALAAQLSTHSAGSYGGGPGASQVAPSPLPTPAPTPSAGLRPAALPGSGGRR